MTNLSGVVLLSDYCTDPGYCGWLMLAPTGSGHTGARVDPRYVGGRVGRSGAMCRLNWVAQCRLGCHAGNILATRQQWS